MENHAPMNGVPKKLKLEKIDALETLRFRFGPETTPTPPLFAHQNFKQEQIDFPADLLPLEVTIDCDPKTLKISSIHFAHEDGPSGASLDKVKSVIRARFLKAYFGAEDRPAVAYPPDSTTDPEPAEVFRLGSGLTVERYLGGWDSFGTWRRAEWLMLFFVDAASQVDADSDSKWEICIARDSSGRIACLASIFNFPTFGQKSPIEKRQRLAQFLTLPCSWGKGYGEALVTYLHQRAIEDPTVDKLTMEDPSDPMFSLRDVIVLKMGIDRGIIGIDCMQTKRWPKEQVWQTGLKIPYVAARRVCEALMVGAHAVGDATSDASYEPLMELREKVKKRIKHMLDECDGYPEEVDAMTDENERLAGQDEYIQEEWETFVDASLRTIKKVFSF